MKINLFKNYINTIKKSVRTKMFQDLYVQKDSKQENITKGGELSCAIYVSAILYLFNLIEKKHATVKGAVADMKHSGWEKIEKPRVGAVIIWGPWKKSSHWHLGFYTGNKKAISNSPEKKVPVEHHWTYNGKRKVEAIYWHESLGLPLEK